MSVTSARVHVLNCLDIQSILWHADTNLISGTEGEELGEFPL